MQDKYIIIILLQVYQLELTSRPFLLRETRKIFIYLDFTTRSITIRRPGRSVFLIYLLQMPSRILMCRAAPQPNYQ